MGFLIGFAYYRVPGEKIIVDARWSFSLPGHLLFFVSFLPGEGWGVHLFPGKRTE